MKIRLVVIMLTLAAATACAGTTGDRARSSITWASHDNGRTVLFWSIEDGGSGVFREGDAELRFPASREDFRRIQRILRPLEGRETVCDDPVPSPGDEPQTVTWLRAVRVALPWYCRSPQGGGLIALSERAFQDMSAMAYARQPEPAPLASVDFISVRYLTWGRAYTAWSVERGGTGRHAEEGDEREFPVSAEAFDRILR